tara:strand:+ start:1856 stop:2521 length:666 start_codon:yes stop_codon:yes gene_type:complete
MKIRKKLIKNFIVQYLLAFIVTIYIFFTKLTSKIVFKNLNIPESFWKSNKPFILVFWHSQLMMISYSWHSKKKINIVASSHSDGRFGSIVGKYFNLNNIATSSDNNKKTVKNILKKLKENNYIGITPDGPRGPKEIVSEGVIKIARSANVPIISCGFWSSKNFKLKSWDSFLITLPFSKCCFVWQKPLYIPKNTNEANIIEYQNQIKKMIDDSINIAKKNI